jgi:hypothetical protein
MPTRIIVILHSALAALCLLSARCGRPFDLDVPRRDVIAFARYTVTVRPDAHGTLKLSAQLFPLTPEEPREARLEIRRGDAWVEVARAAVLYPGWDAPFRLRRADPDLLFFAGDQTYRHTQHTVGWIEFGLQFRDVIRDRPTSPTLATIGRASTDRGSNSSATDGPSAAATRRCGS